MSKYLHSWYVRIQLKYHYLVDRLSHYSKCIMTIYYYTLYTVEPHYPAGFLLVLTAYRFFTLVNKLMSIQVFWQGVIHWLLYLNLD